MEDDSPDAMLAESNRQEPSLSSLRQEEPRDGGQGAEEKPGRGRRLGFLAAVVAVCAFLYVTDWDVLSSQFTAYRVACETVVVGNECGRQVIAVNTINYMVLVDQKYVVEKDNPPTTYTNCAITSRTDWKS